MNSTRSKVRSRHIQVSVAELLTKQMNSNKYLLVYKTNMLQLMQTY